MIFLPPPPEPERARRVLPNGGSVIVERREGVPLTLCLTLSLEGLDPILRRRGVAHLVEHLAMRETSAREDGTLEAAGGWSFARTTRDVMQIVHVVPASARETAVPMIFGRLRLAAFDEAAIRREAGIIREEGADRPLFTRVAAELGARLEPGSDEPLGDPDMLARVTPEEVSESARALLGGRIVATAVGPGDPLVLSGELSERLSLLSRRKGLSRSKPKLEKAAYGDARTRIVAGIDRPRGQAALGAALAWASVSAGGWASMEPRPEWGAISLNLPGGPPDAPSPALARTALAGWFAQRREDAVESVQARGVLASFRPGLDLDPLEAEAAPTDAAFAEEIEAWRLCWP